MAARQIKKLIPLADRILIQKVKPTTQTASGVFIPTKAQEADNTGKVVAVGKGITKADGSVIPLTVKEGDHVLLSKYGGTPIEFQNEEHLIVREDDILAILEH